MNARSPSSLGRSLRVGVVLESLFLPAWIERVLRDLTSTSVIDCTFVAVVNRALTSSADGSPHHPKGNRSSHPSPIWDWYEAADYRRFCQAADDPLTMVDVTGLLGAADVPVVSFADGDVFSDAFVTRLTTSPVDVVLCFADDAIQKAVAHIPRYGVWTIHHGDARGDNRGPALFWEIYDRCPESTCTLRVRTQHSALPKVICRAVGATNQGSLYLNRRQLFWKSVDVIRRRLSDLHREGWEFIESLDTYQESDDRVAELATHAPTNWQMVRFLATTTAHRLQTKIGKRLDERWVIGYRHRTRSADATFRIVEPPRGRFFADPFLAEVDGRTFIFFEDYCSQMRKGIISRVEVLHNGSTTPVEPVLERPYHLSYPSIFRWRGDWWMVPESGQRRTVELYRSLAFPHDWVLEAILLDNVEARDATLCEVDGRWWMFVTVSVPGGPLDDELSLFHADCPTGPWRPHRRNPIVSDVRRARSAGAVQRKGSSLIRPGQDCSRGYGYAVTFNRIDRLTEREYSEVQVGSFLPHWHPRIRATHTFNQSPSYEVVDGRLRRIFDYRGIW